MKFIFFEFNKLNEIKVSNKFNKEKVTNMSAMFQGCSNITNLDLSNFNSLNANDMCVQSLVYLRYVNSLILSLRIK